MENSFSSYFAGVRGGLVMSMIAFSIVFIVIIGLMLLMMGMKYICSAIDKIGTSKSAPAQKTVPVSASPVKTVAAEDSDELLAVIAAAIFAMCGSAARVVSFSPVTEPVVSYWKLMGRMQNAEGRQD